LKPIFNFLSDVTQQLRIILSSLDTDRLKKNVHSSLEVDFTETLKLKYDTKPPKLSSHGEEDELGV